MINLTQVLEHTYDITDLTTGYGSRRRRVELLRGMTARLCRGELTCLIGVNGAGKSTLLRTLAGLQPALEGEVRLADKALRDYSALELARKVSVVLTDDVPEQNLTALELVAMGRMPYTGYWGGLREEDSEAVARALEMVGMSAMANRRIGEMSDGERQKLMIAKALAQDTDVILMDEPVAFLDFPSKVSVLRLMSRVAKEWKRSVLMSIHDLGLALQMADRLWILNGNEFIEGEPSQLAREGKIDFLFDGEGIEFDRERLGYRLRKD